MKEKHCTKCGQLKPLSEFYGHKGLSDGKRPDCKLCTKEIQQKYYSTENGIKKRKAYSSSQVVRNRQNESRRSEKGKSSYWRRAHASPSFALSFALYRALKRCPTKNAITHAELMEMYRSQRGLCALTGIEMVWQRGGLKPNSMTMDKIVPALGYAKDNIRLICHAVNMFRGQMSDQEMLDMAKRLVNHMDPEQMHWIESNDDDRAWIQ